MALLLVKVNGKWVTPGQAAKLVNKAAQNLPEGENKPEIPGQQSFQFRSIPW